MTLDDILIKVDKPARYTGGEVNMCFKENALVNFVFSYPDTYEMGMSHLGGKIIYHLLIDLSSIFSLFRKKSILIDANTRRH